MIGVTLAAEMIDVTLAAGMIDVILAAEMIDVILVERIVIENQHEKNVVVVVGGIGREIEKVVVVAVVHGGAPETIEDPGRSGPLEKNVILGEAVLVMIVDHQGKTAGGEVVNHEVPL